MLKLKKMIAVALFGIGAGASVTAMAIPSYETCYGYREACVFNGDEEACDLFNASRCSRYVYPF
ncbi:hypothetical protein GTP41_05230 [Pseudoduganella sp. DS3]|uniref:DUF3551 domain-containing protein n=1 Tax=Pseudoduganella guangdongensis TaxID=2692179 RepID=A0A6N9HDH7_9BURK|nr:hypothetical protein [Pseudoduganella guangdongensis]MYN01496.1 hypothetical protein [Pseudoduganella guangdongensis]